jgi:hypothetical protein
MKRLAFAALLLAGCALPAHSATRVWGFWGLGDNWLGTSAGVEQIADQARRIPGVVSVRTGPYWDTQRVANEIAAAPRGDHIVLYGYSCGGNSVTTLSTSFAGRRHMDIAAIQPSVWCGGRELQANVDHAKNTHSPCYFNFGLGCYRIRRAAGNTTTTIEDITRVRMHLFADLDRQAQADVLRVIARGQRGRTRVIY